MTTLIEAAKQALEALERYAPQHGHPDDMSDAITALRIAIAEAEKQEPVAWAVVGDGEHGEYEVGRMLEKKSKPNSQYWEARGYSLVPLYTTPPAAPVHEQTTTENNGGKTGWPPGLLQDDNSRLSKWFAGRPDARYQLRKHMKEDIIRMAREADLWLTSDERIAAVERFAALAIADERNKLAAWMMAQGYATGHGDTIEDLLSELDWQVKERVGAEREAIIQMMPGGSCVDPQWVCDAIRARGQT